MQKIIQSLIVAFVLNISINSQSIVNYTNSALPLEDRVEAILKELTLKEKVMMCHAVAKFSSGGVPRLGIPELTMDDGPHGVRAEVLRDSWNAAGWNNDSCTVMPALTCLAATWNTDLAKLYGNVIGNEARWRNKSIMLGPGVNIYRIPLNGRNFEYMGEDPYLASRMVVPYIQGVQEKGVASCVKHYMANNQEYMRGSINVEMDDRALYEIYLPAFKAAIIEANALSIMCAYNKFRGSYCSENDFLQNQILKKDWGFKGVVISDWGAVHSPKSAINGMDIEMGSHPSKYSDYYLADTFYLALKKEDIPMSVVDDKVRRILRVILQTALKENRQWGAFTTTEHFAASRKIAQEGIVLLKNEKAILPIDTKKVKTIAVIGENADRKMSLGGGSAELKAKYEISPLQGIINAAGSSVKVTYIPGYATRRNTNAQNAVALAKKSDMVIFVGGLNHDYLEDCEGGDRLSMDLLWGQNDLIDQIMSVNSNTVVVLISGNAVAMPWLNKVPAVLQAWYAGSEAGNALADVLFGKVNPSGKLPFTFPAKLSDCPAIAKGAYPGNDTNVIYKEGIYVGYRYYDTYKVNPLFCFGYGLSYTQFEYSNIILSKPLIKTSDTLIVSFTIKNTGALMGGEVAQLYIKDVLSSLDRPEKELKAFTKVFLNAGESKNISMKISKEALSYYSTTKKGWFAEPGDFEVMIGASSKDIRLKAAFILQ